MSLSWSAYSSWSIVRLWAKRRWRGGLEAGEVSVIIIDIVVIIIIISYFITYYIIHIYIIYIIDSCAIAPRKQARTSHRLDHDIDGRGRRNRLPFSFLKPTHPMLLFLFTRPNSEDCRSCCVSSKIASHGLYWQHWAWCLGRLYRSLVVETVGRVWVLGGLEDGRV